MSEAQTGPEIQDGGLYPDVPEPLRSHLHFLNGALSFYDGSEAAPDVAQAWREVTAVVTKFAPLSAAAERYAAAFAKLPTPGKPFRGEGDARAFQNLALAVSALTTECAKFAGMSVKQ